MRIEKDDNLSGGYRIFGSSDSWDIEEGRLSIRVSDAKIIPMSGDDMFIDIYGEGPQQIAEDIVELSRKAGREELDRLKAENESLKETIEVLQRQLEKERDKNAVKSETVQGADNDRDALDARTYVILPIKEHAKTDPELYTATKFIVARYNETVRENECLRKRNNKLKKDVESIKGHLRVAQHKLNEYGRKKHYSEILVDSHSRQSLTFKDAKVSVSSNGDVTVSGQSVENLIDRLDRLIDTEARFTEWQDIVLKQVEGNPGIFNEHIKEN